MEDFLDQMSVYGIDVESELSAELARAIEEEMLKEILNGKRV